MTSIHQEKGATMVEFAVVSATFLFVVLVGAELLRLSYTNLTLQFVATRVLRQAVIGPPPDADPSYDHTAETESSILALANGLGIDLLSEDVRICAAPNLNCSIDNAGDGGDLIVIRITKPTNILFFGTYVVRSLIVGKNEQF